MHFIKSVEDYENYKNSVDLNTCVGPLRNELDVFNNIYTKFKTINVPVLNLNDFQEYLKDNVFDCIATISNNKIIVCDNSTGNKWTEEFDLDDYSCASDWCLGKIEYQDYLNYQKYKSNNYTISIWETEDDRNYGECFDYPETFFYKSEAIQMASRLIKSNNYACIEVIDSKNKCVYWSDGKEEERFNELNSNESKIQM